MKFERGQHEDQERYRVSLICSCQGDLAYGYGASEKEARTTAVAEFRKHHGRRARWDDEIIERVTDDGTHYEEVP